MTWLPWNRNRREQSETDLLTGVLSRPAWLEVLRHAMARARTTGEPLCIAAIDLGGLEQPGGAIAAGALDGARLVARAARTTLPSGDLIGHLDGDRLGIVLRDVNLGDAQEAMNRLRASLGEAWRCSVGLASWAGYDSPEDLCREAVRALEEGELVRPPETPERDAENGSPVPLPERGAPALNQTVPRRTVFPAS